MTVPYFITWDDFVAALSSGDWTFLSAHALLNYPFVAIVTLAACVIVKPRALPRVALIALLLFDLLPGWRPQ